MLDFSPNLEEKEEVELTDGALATVNGAWNRFGGGCHGGRYCGHSGGYWSGGFVEPLAVPVPVSVPYGVGYGAPVAGYCGTGACSNTSSPTPVIIVNTPSGSAPATVEQVPPPPMR